MLSWIVVCPPVVKSTRDDSSSGPTLMMSGIRIWRCVTLLSPSMREARLYQNRQYSTTAKEPQLTSSSDLAKTLRYGASAGWYRAVCESSSPTTQMHRHMAYSSATRVSCTQTTRNSSIQVH